jgi:hypothetical protein
MRSPEHILRHVVRCDWRCKHCREIIGSERVAHYGADLPDLIKPTWFFAAMTLLDHLRDCPGGEGDGHEAGGRDYSEALRKEYGRDFLNHPLIYNWYNEHALIERHFVAQEELE